MALKVFVERDARPRPKRLPRHHATGDHYFDADEMEFLSAMERFKNTTGKRFPTWSDCLTVIKALGYTKFSEDDCEFGASINLAST